MMAKIFIFGTSMGAAYLGYLSIDGGTEEKIKANGMDIAEYEKLVPDGEHFIKFYINSKFKRFIVRHKDGANSQSEALETYVTMAPGDVLVLEIIRKGLNTKIESYFMQEEAFKTQRTMLWAIPMEQKKRYYRHG